MLEQSPSDEGDYFVNLAFAYDRAGRTFDAEAAARRACELEPDSEGAWIALAYALAFPIVRRRMERKTRHLTADDEEFPRLMEAIQAVGKAAAILRQRDRQPMLVEVLGNALAIYAAANEDAAALEIGLELRQNGLRSEIAARNLLFIQMRCRRFTDALITADDSCCLWCH